MVEWAARFARQFDAVLVCAASRLATITSSRDIADESVGAARPIGPRPGGFWDTAVFDSGLATRIRDQARDAGVEVEFQRELAGGIGHALARLAQVLDAEMIVVGSRRGGGMRSSMHEFLSGSVAVHLAHRQARPLVVIPVSPKQQGHLPWEHYP